MISTTHDVVQHTQEGRASNNISTRKLVEIFEKNKI